MWGNRFGGWDTFVFVHNKTDKGKVKARNYIKQFGQWDNLSFNYTPLTSGEIDFVKDIENTGTITTEYITRELQNWLVEGLAGLGYVLYDPAGDAVTVKITTTSWTEGQDRFDDLFFESWKYMRTNLNRTVKL